MKNKKPIYVVQPSMPPLEEFIPYLEQIWDKKILTNNGPFHQQLEQELCRYLGVEHISLFNNATNALLTSLKTLDVSGEVITTPYSFVATSHSLIWNGIKPVFADISPKTCNINPDRIEAAITPQTSAIMAVHCYGNPCDVENIERIAQKHNLQVIYDAAHAFGNTYKGESLLRYGNLSVLSFHATKVFNTFEGGAIISPDAKTKQRIDCLKNFGFSDEVTVMGVGLNGKLDEVSSAFGLLQLKHVDKAIEKRRRLFSYYRSRLSNLPGIRLLCDGDAEKLNCSYFPIYVGSEYPLSRTELNDKLKSSNINPRKYFYPLISEFPMYSGEPSSNPENLPIAGDIAERVLCLPIYPELPESVIDQIVDIMSVSQNSEDWDFKKEKRP